MLFSSYHRPIREAQVHRLHWRCDPNGVLGGKIVAHVGRNECNSRTLLRSLIVLAYYKCFTQSCHASMVTSIVNLSLFVIICHLNAAVLEYQ
jgi:hypothetical protein